MYMELVFVIYTQYNNQFPVNNNYEYKYIFNIRAKYENINTWTTIIVNN